ncbi:MAG: hypothetical protein H7840_01090 [Alphaproteobacteria bacterium]
MTDHNPSSMGVGAAAPQFYRVFHFDDEIHTVNWIPLSIYETLCDHYPSLEDDPAGFVRKGKGRQVEICVNEANTPFKIIYNITDDIEAFESMLKHIIPDDLSRTLIIIDLMMPYSAAGITSNAGESIFNSRNAEEKMRIMFLTAYRRGVKQEILNEIGNDRVWEKPPPIEEFTEAVLNMLGIKYRTKRGR